MDWIRYLGTSMWDVYYINRTISVKILDSEWLTQFQTREVDVRPGDSLKAEVLVDVGYGYDNNVVSEHFSVPKIFYKQNSQDNAKGAEKVFA